MTFWAILPVKPLRLGKSRLAGVLDENERYRLNQDLLKNSLQVLTEVAEIERVLVISRDPQVLAMARDFRACTLQESGSRGLNTALNKATQMARSFAVQSVLVVPADLPLINIADIQELLALAEHPPVVVIAPDRHRRGTNALVVNPLGALRYAFGRDSFHTHCQQALCSEVRLEVAELPKLAVDLDTPDDIEFLRWIDSRSNVNETFLFITESLKPQRELIYRQGTDKYKGFELPRYGDHGENQRL
jgi:2-phospho-L-lactate/phosphoenolpyruvate guanylyltransferase